MRKLTEPQAHRGRVAIIEGRFPEGMQARCAWCGKVGLVEEGEMLETSPHASGPARVFRCGECTSKEESAA